jgi:hypothetical protein
MPTLLGAYEVVTHASLEEAGVAHGFTTARGEANGALVRTQDVTSFARSMGFPAAKTLTQVHRGDVVRAESSEDGARADAVVTRAPGVLLAIQTADCVPVLLFDPQKRAVGAAHAGWRGTAARIGPAAVHEMTAAYGTAPRDVHAVLGPAIGPCCFEVGTEVLEALEQSARGAGQSAGRTPAGRDTANLWRANRMQLEAAGIARDNIHVVNHCTRCRADLYPSYRRDGETCGRIYAFIGLRGPAIIGV